MENSSGEGRNASRIRTFQTAQGGRNLSARRRSSHQIWLPYHRAISVLLHHPQRKRIHQRLFSENSFIVSYTAMLKKTESFFTIQALEDSLIHTVSYDRWLSLLHEDPFWTKLLISLLEKGYMKKESRERELLLLSAEERYVGFLLEYPGLEDRIKQHLIASYLGITPQALSRIRKHMQHKASVNTG
jgi:CRP-like cAMP-binding protein